MTRRFSFLIKRQSTTSVTDATVAFILLVVRQSVSSSASLGPHLYIHTYAHMLLTEYTGLSVHLNQVHKENLTQVDNALPNRAAPDIEIFGMEGIPEDILLAHNQRISHDFFAAEAQRRAISGNFGPGGGGGGGGGGASTGNNQTGPGVKKPKFESPAELKQRLAEHKAKKAAAEASGSVGSDPNTPVSLFDSNLTILSTQYSNMAAQSRMATPPPIAPVHRLAHVMPPAANPVHQAYPAPYGQPPIAPPPQVPAPFYGAQQSPPYNNYGEAYGVAPPLPHPGAYPPGQFAQQPHFQPAPQQYGDPSAVGGYPAPYQQFQPPPMVHHQPHSVSPFNQYSQRPPRVSPPVQPQPQRPLAAAPGLPQRPSFNAPHVSREQLAEMHHGSLNAAGEPQQAQTGPAHANSAPFSAQSVDDLISSAAQQSVQPPAAQLPLSAKPSPVPAGTPHPVAAEKKADVEPKKVKKASRLVYPEQDTSPEEQLAHLSLYEFAPDTGGETIRDPVDANLTG